MINSRRILIGSVDALPKIGGVSLMAHYLAVEFQRAGNEVVFLAPAGSFVPAGYDRAYHLYTDDDSRVAHRAGKDGLLEDRRIRRLTQRLISNYGIERVLLLHPFYYGIGVDQAARNLGVPVSLYFHGYEFRSQVRALNSALDFSKFDLDTPAPLPERTVALANRVDQICCNSTYTREQLASYMDRGKILVTGCGLPSDQIETQEAVSPSYSQHARQERRLRLALPNVVRSVAYVGRLVGSKRVDRVIGLVEKLPEWGLTIVGEGLELAALKEIVVERGLSERVRFLGAVSEDMKWEVLQASDVIALASEDNSETGAVEGFGIALLEGAAAGALPVSSGTGGMSDVIDNGKSGLILDFDDLAASADVLSGAFRDQVKIQRMVSSARSEIRTRYNWSSIAARMMDSWDRAEGD